MAIDLDAKLLRRRTLERVITVAMQNLQHLCGIDLRIEASHRQGQVVDASYRTPAPLLEAMVVPPHRFDLHVPGEECTIWMLCQRVDGPDDDYEAGDWCGVAPWRDKRSVVLAIAVTAAIATECGELICDETNLLGGGRLTDPAGRIEALRVTGAETFTEAASAIVAKTRLVGW
jgi:hypothetical protein